MRGCRGDNGLLVRGSHWEEKSPERLTELKFTG